MIVILLFFNVYLLCCIYFYLSIRISRSATCLQNKTAIVTGANSGIGYETALNLASRGCKVIMADINDMKNTQFNIIKLTNNPNIITKHIDLSSLKSVRQFAEDIKQTEERIDILVNNAGILHSVKDVTDDGINPVMQVNYFGHFLLTHLLKDLLKKSSPSRIVFTTSVASHLANLTVENLRINGKNYTMLDKILLYSNSKLALLIASDLFSIKLRDAGITSNSVNPGPTLTSIGLSVVSNEKIVGFFQRFTKLCFLKDPWEGSQGLIHVATSKEFETISGIYISGCKEASKPFKAWNSQFCKRIWEESEKIVGLQDHEKI